MSPSQLKPIINKVNLALSSLPDKELYFALISIINEISEIIKNEPPSHEEHLNELYVLAVFLRGVMDYLKIKHLVSKSKWTKKPKTLEQVWNTLWDCRSRTRFFSHAVSGSIKENIDSFLDKLDTFYHDNFGPGLYASTDILIKQSSCSLCKRNIKLCNHVPGRLYSGKMCQQTMDDFELISVSMVTNPHDPRCRYWPWNVDTKDKTLHGVIFTIFQVDDFSNDCDWSKKLVFN